MNRNSWQQRNFPIDSPLAGERGQVRHAVDERRRLYFPTGVRYHPFYPINRPRYYHPIIPTTSSAFSVPLIHNPYERIPRGLSPCYQYPGDYYIPQSQQPPFSIAETPSRCTTRDTDVTSTSVSIATGSSVTPQVQVKIEKTETPPPQTEAGPRSPPDTSTTGYGYLTKNQVDVTPRSTGRQLLYRPQCPVCLKTFSRSGTLKVHMRIHSGDKPFHCQYCSKTFTQSGNLAAHERIHTGEKPYQCKYCGKRFTQSSAQKSHVMIHISKELL